MGAGHIDRLAFVPSRLRQSKRKHAALVVFALDAYRAAVVLDDVLDDAQAETGAAGGAAAGFVGAVKTLEQPRDVVGKDADASVGNGYRH